MEFDEQYFTEDTPLQAIGNLKNRLRNISQGIKERNKDLACQYPYLLPENIPNGVDV